MNWEIRFGISTLPCVKKILGTLEYSTGAQLSAL